ncbi:MAG: DNA ligase, partial [Mesorhizobium sp.]
LVKPAKGIIQYSEHVEGGGAAFFEAVEKMGLEGMVSKRRESPYKSGKIDAWVKTKCWELGEFELLGIRREPGKA